MHRNPVVRGLVTDPADWPWSSYRSYAYSEPGLVRINDWRWWEEEIRHKAETQKPHFSRKKRARNGAPKFVVNP
jgi:hypothetical protein